MLTEFGFLAVFLWGTGLMSVGVGICQTGLFLVCQGSEYAQGVGTERRIWLCKDAQRFLCREHEESKLYNYGRHLRHDFVENNALSSCTQCTAVDSALLAHLPDHQPAPGRQDSRRKPVVKERTG